MPEKAVHPARAGAGSASDGRELRILILEDVATDAELVEAELRRAHLRFTARRIQTRDDLLHQLDAFAPDIILADYSLPQFTALDALHLLKERGSGVPLILVTGTQTEEIAVECMKQGAHDYILKDRLIRLPASVQQACRNREMERKKESAEAELRRSQLQLIQAAKMESVGRLAAGVAHEVKNPLTTLLLGVEYLHQHLDSTPELQTILHDMDAAVQRANRVILGLLDFSMPGQLESRPEDLNGILEESLELVKHALAKSRVQVERALAPDLPRLGLDSNKIEQVFVNLFLNAIAAMPGGGTLAVGTRVERTRGGARTGGGPEAPAAFVVAEVEDTGNGIDPEHLQHVFDPFFTTRRSGGSGLGLAITRKIVEMHGGEITLENRPQGGVRVRLQLPLEGTDA